jgi:hypothetical protein
MSVTSIGVDVRRWPQWSLGESREGGPVCPVVGRVCQPVRERHWLTVLGVEPGWESLAGWVGAVGPSLFPDKFSNLSHGTVVGRVSQPVTAGHTPNNRRGLGPQHARREGEPPCEPPLGVPPRISIPLGSARRSTAVVHGVGSPPARNPSAARSRTTFGVPGVVGGGRPGVFASLDPRLMSMTPVGVDVRRWPQWSMGASPEGGPVCPVVGRVFQPVSAGHPPNNPRGLGPQPA